MTMLIGCCIIIHLFKSLYNLVVNFLPFGSNSFDSFHLYITIHTFNSIICIPDINIMIGVLSFLFAI